MKIRFHFTLLCLVSVALSFLQGQAVEKVDPDLPQPLDLSVTQPLLEKSPFTRPLDLSQSLQLTGLAYVEGKPVATLVDRETKKSHLVSEEPNDLGWRLAEANLSVEMRLTNVKIMVGNELITIHYSDAQLAPSSRGGTGPSHYPTDSEAIRNDENGKPYVRASVYLSDADRDRYYKNFSREAHDKFRDVVRGNRETMFKASPQERAVIAKKLFDTVEAEDKARHGGK
ncbi:hypothetical protein BH11VER1_BH11VER1_03570 [soil metagenome]